MKFRYLGLLLQWVPKKALSRFTGWVVHLKLPWPFGPWSVRWFARRYRINLQEAEKPIAEYLTIAALFTRRLKKGIRPVGKGLVLNPCDATINQSGRISNETLIQAKSKTYTTRELLGDNEFAKRFEGGLYAVYYLCPTDYHRVHSPVDGKIMGSWRLGGTLWPVNEWSVENIEKLFVINERVVTKIETANGFAAVVMVGATNVGKITLSFAPHINKSYEPPIPIARADEFGIFHMGSTVIVLFERGILSVSEFEKGTVLFGADAVSRVP
jgi:phosphatidylserine decarboxylase